MTNEISLRRDWSALVSNEEAMLSRVNELNDFADLLEANTDLKALEQVAILKGLDDVANKLRRVRLAVVCRIAELNPPQEVGRGKITDRAVILSQQRLSDYRTAAKGLQSLGGMEAIKELDEVPTVKELVQLGRQEIKPHVSHNSGENEWYTPPDILERARRVLDGIGLDPASSDAAQVDVRAETYYTIQEDGLAQTWKGRVWMNPPYSSELIGRFIEKLLDSDFEQAITLTNNATETQWGRELLTYPGAVVCFPTTRVRFRTPSGQVGAPLQGQMICGFKVDHVRFKQEFQAMGAILHG